MYLRNLAIFEKLSHLFNKASIILKMSSNHFKKASNSLKIFLKCHAFLKKSLAFSIKKSFTAIAALPQ
jgi:hypothetical protein